MTTTPRHTLVLGAAAGSLSAAARGDAATTASVVVRGAPTPLTAAGSRVIDAPPGAVKDWAIRATRADDYDVLLSATSRRAITFVTRGWSLTSANAATLGQPALSAVGAVSTQASAPTALPVDLVLAPPDR